jgi:alpha-1,2-mannosyltransferase
MNVAWPELYGLFGRASAGIHTMQNEHFGINVVEFMASGVIPVSNNSGKCLGTSPVLIKEF